MICPYCKTNNTSLAKTCWSCGRELPPQEPELKSAAHPSGNNTVRVVQKQPPVNTSGDFWIGFWGGLFGMGIAGMICATIIDKREGFWAAFWGSLLSGIIFVALIVWRMHM